MKMKTAMRINSAAIILGWLVAAVAVITVPLWIGPAIIWMIVTGRSLKSCGHEANAMSGME
jgi:hypothetical protein